MAVTWQDEAEQEDGNGHGHYSNDNGVDHSPSDLGAGFCFLVEIFGQFLKHITERAGDFGGGNHINIEVTEDIAMFGEGLGEASPLLNTVLDIQDYGPELRVFILLSNGFERVLQTNTGSDHNGELICEVEDVFSAGAELDSEVFHFLHGAFPFGIGTAFPARIYTLFRCRGRLVSVI
jgi:hypothetical protein